MPNKYRMTEPELEVYAEKMREKAQPQLKQDLIVRVFEAAQKAGLAVLLAAEGDEKWAIEKDFGGKSAQDFLQDGKYIGLGEQKLWFKTEPVAKPAKKKKK